MYRGQSRELLAIIMMLSHPYNYDPLLSSFTSCLQYVRNLHMLENVQMVAAIPYLHLCANVLTKFILKCIKKIMVHLNGNFKCSGGAHHVWLVLSQCYALGALKGALTVTSEPNQHLIM